MLLIGFPMCRAFSVLRSLDFKKMERNKAKELLAHRTNHMRFCIELYWEQTKEGRCFLHEHPNLATSWGLAEMILFLINPNVIRTTGDMFAHE